MSNIIDRLKELFPDSKKSIWKPGNRKVNPEIVLAAYKHNTNIAALAREFGAAWSTIDSIVNGRRRSDPNIDKDKAWLLYQNGFRLVDIATVFSISDAGSIGRFLAKHYGDAYTKLARQRRRNQSRNKCFSRDDAFSLYHTAGWPLQKIADHYGVTTGAIHHAIKGMPGYKVSEINIQKSRFKYGPNIKARKFSYETALDLYLFGFSLNEIAVTLNVTSSTVSFALKTFPEYREAVKAKKFQHIVTALSLYREGWSLKQIGEHYDMDPASIHKHLQKLPEYRNIVRRPWEYKKHTTNPD
jgi:predicted DNA-binding protein YlxM (UPF0122 family)